MTQQVYVGIDIETQSGLYGGVSPITYEEGATNGFGVRMTAARRYHNWFTQVFATSSLEGGFFDSGHLIVISVSNLMSSGQDLKTHDGKTVSSVTHKKVAAGNYDTDIDAMWDRVCALTFDANVAGGSAFGGIKQPYIIFIYEHEMDAKGVDGQPGNYYYSNGWVSGGTGNGTKDTNTDYINAWTHVHSRWTTRAAANSVATSRVQFAWCMTAYGFSPDRVSQYWPGGQYVDFVAPDPYWAPSQTYPQMVGAARTFAIAKGKPMGYPELNIYNSSGTEDTQARADAFTALGTYLANDTQVTHTFLNLWVAPDSSSNQRMNFNKVSGASASGKSFPLTHAGLATMITTLGSNPILTGTTQGLPSVATGVSVTPGADGTTATGTWADPPSGDNVLGWYWYIAPGTTDVLVNQNKTSPLAAGTRSVSITGLSPSTDYSFDVVPYNSAGKAGFGQIANFTTATPGGVNAAPNIATFTAVPESGTPTSADFNITASDPNSLAITISVTVTAPALGFTETFSMTSGTQATRSYTQDGLYAATATVSNGTLTTSATTTFQINSQGTTTPGQGWGIAGLLPGTDPRGTAATCLAIFRALDIDITNLQTYKSLHNALHGLVASAFDPINCAGSNVFTSASGYLIWVAMELQDYAINGITTITATAQSGTGVQLGIHDSGGALLKDTAGNVCSYGLSAAQTSVDVDGWLGTSYTTPTPPPRLTFPAPISGTNKQNSIGPGSVVYASLFFPSGLSTYPTFRETSAGSVEACVNLDTQPRYGCATGQTGIGDPIPFGSWDSTHSSPVWMGLF